MSYYQTLGLAREPFANSPDPELLYRSKTHLECLQHMEIAVRLRRGLNVVLGDVGTGKTTLCRELIRILGEDPDVEIHVLDDPFFPTTGECLLALGRLFGLDVSAASGDEAALKDALKACLLQKGANGRHIVTLLVDEGQKMTGECLELLRELLNFETNSHKLLQIIIFAQKEFDEALLARPNLDDRVNFRYELVPLNRYQTGRLIRTRFSLCTADDKTPALFTRAALRRIYRLTGGYPRKIVRLCHMSMLLCVGLGRRRITWGMVGRAARETRVLPAGGRWSWSTAATGLGLAGLLTLAGLGVRAVVPSQWTELPAAWRTTSGTLAKLPAIAAHRSLTALAESHGPESQGDQARLFAAAVAPAEAGPAAALPETVRSAAASTPAVPAAPASRPAAPVPVVSSAPVSAETPAQPAAAASQASQALAATVADDKPPLRTAPETLGTAVIRPGWTASQQTVWLYGSSRRSLLNRLAKANPGVNVDRIRAGQSLTFPAIAASALPAGSQLIKVREVSDLEQGFGFLAKHRQSASPLALFVTFQPATGLHYEVVVSTFYANQAAAKAAMAQMPATLAGRATLVSSYPADTVYYTNMASLQARRGGSKLAGAVETGPHMAARDEQ